MASEVYIFFKGARGGIYGLRSWGEGFGLSIIEKVFGRVFVMKNCDRERGGGGREEIGGLLFTTSLFSLLSLHKTWFMLVLSYHVLGFFIGLFTWGDNLHSDGF